MSIWKRNLSHDRFKQNGHQIYINFAIKCKNAIKKYYAKREMAIIKQKHTNFTFL